MNQTDRSKTATRQPTFAAAHRLLCTTGLPCVVVLLIAVGPNVARAVDTVETATMRRPGKITNMTPTTVTIERGTQSSDVPVNEIVTIRFDGEPRELNIARGLAERGNFAEARSRIEAFEDEDLSNARVREDVEYLLAHIAAHEALAGQGDVAEAGRQMLGFVNQHPDNYHYFAATELIAQLLMAGSRHDQALEFAGKLAEAPWPEYQLRAGNIKGQIHRDQQQFNEALAEYDAVLAAGADSDDEAIARQRLTATLGKAECLSALDRAEEGVGLVTEVIATTDAEDAPRQAQAYNALGNCYRAAGRTKDALLAFLHVDILYSSQHDAHAEALANLAELWQATNHSDRSTDARQRLLKAYPQSRWAQSQ